MMLHERSGVVTTPNIMVANRQFPQYESGLRPQGQWASSGSQGPQRIVRGEGRCLAVEVQAISIVRPVLRASLRV